jgi:hypothetical protein
MVAREASPELRTTLEFVPCSKSLIGKSDAGGTGRMCLFTIKRSYASQNDDRWLDLDSGEPLPEQTPVEVPTTEEVMMAFAEMNTEMRDLKFMMARIETMLARGDANLTL